MAYIPGIGIDTATFFENSGLTTKESGKGMDSVKCLRDELKIPEKAVVILSVGDLIVRKNQKTVIKAMGMLHRNDLFLVLCGQGPLMKAYVEMAQSFGIYNNIRFVGYRKDIRTFYKMADLFVFPSYQEGLSVAAMEAMASSLPLVLSNIRGNVDLISDGEGGFLCDPNDSEAFARKINLLANHPELRKKMGEVNIKRIRKYDIVGVDKRMRKIYKRTLG